MQPSNHVYASRLKHLKIMRKIKFVITTMSALFLSALSYGQINVSAELTNSWTLVKTIDQVEIYAVQQECSVTGKGQSWIYASLRIVNNSSEQKNVHFNFGLKFEEGCDGCKSPTEASRNISIQAGQTLVGDCSFEHGELSRLIRNPNLQGGWNFQNIELNNLIVD